MKKITAVLLSAAIAFTATACSRVIVPKKADGGNSNENSKTISTSATVPSSETTQPETTVSTTAETTTTTTTTTTTQANGAARNLDQFKGKKLIAITFDDGPYTPVTCSLLDRLDKYNARVTFFVLGSRLDGSQSYRETMKRAYEMGNQIASHTYSHSDLTSLSKEALYNDVAKANAAVKNVIGVEPTAIRPPYGAINSTVEAAANKNIIMWSVDSLDWKYRNADTVCSNICNSAFDGAIVLLHDLYQTSVDGAIRAMDILQGKGYAFVTVDELAQLRGVQMNTSTKYFQFKPQN